MFGKLTIFIETSTALSIIAIALAISAIILLKHGLEQLITGASSNTASKHPRKTGFILTTLSLVMLTASIVSIIESDNLALFLSQQIKLFKKYMGTTAKPLPNKKSATDTPIDKN